MGGGAHTLHTPCAALGAPCQHAQQLEVEGWGATASCHMVSPRAAAIAAAATPAACEDSAAAAARLTGRCGQQQGLCEQAPNPSAVG